MKNDLFADLFIFEMANNHQGSVKHGVKIIKEMSKIASQFDIHAGMKFQYRHLDTFIHPDYKNKKDIMHIPRFIQTRLTDEEFHSIYVYLKSIKPVKNAVPKAIPPAQPVK